MISKEHSVKGIKIKMIETWNYIAFKPTLNLEIRVINGGSLDLSNIEITIVKIPAGSRLKPPRPQTIPFLGVNKKFSVSFKIISQFPSLEGVVEGVIYFTNSNDILIIRSIKSDVNSSKNFSSVRNLLSKEFEPRVAKT